MHVLIIGAAGMIGRKLTQRLARDSRLGESENAALSLVDVAQPEKPARFLGRVSAERFDIAEAGAIEGVIAARPDVIFHLAVVVSGEAEADFEKGYRVNLDGVRSLLEAVRRRGRGTPYQPRFVFASSIALFGAPFPGPIGDEFFATLLTGYGAQKAISGCSFATIRVAVSATASLFVCPLSALGLGSRTGPRPASSRTFCASRLSGKRLCCLSLRTCVIGMRAPRGRGISRPRRDDGSCRDGRAPRTHHAGTFAVKARRART